MYPDRVENEMLRATKSSRRVGPFLRIDELPALCGISRSTIYRELRFGRFPPPLRLSENRVAWEPEAIEKWLSERQPTTSQKERAV